MRSGDIKLPGSKNGTDFVNLLVAVNELMGKLPNVLYALLAVFLHDFIIGNIPEKLHQYRTYFISRIQTMCTRPEIF